jgi:NodT family efflux transporter outer membrane factor (OMF) lipoprotein
MRRPPMREVLAIGLLSALALTGCAVGPNYVAPRTPPSAAGAFVSATPEASSEAALPDQWWRLYNDPVLDRLVLEALTENKDLKVAAANLAFEQALVGEARAGLFPSTDLSAGTTYGRSSTGALFSELTGAPNPNSTYSQFGFTASYEVDLFGRVRRTIEAAHASAQASQAAEDAVRVAVASQTAGAYANVCTFGEAVNVAKHNLAVVQQAYDLTATERNAGAASDLDITRQAVLLDQAKAILPTVEGQRRSALFELAALIGKTPAEIPHDAEACVTPPQVVQALPVGDGAALLRRRPDVREAERNLASAVAKIGVSAADLYPTVSLGGQVAGVGVTPAQLTSTSGLSFGVGPLINWSFPNILVARAHVKESSAQASASLASFDSVVLQALKETEQALTTYAGELQHNAATRAARDDANKAFSLAKTLYQSGASSFLDLLTAEQTEVSAEQALATSDQQLAADQIAVFQALGGGWETAPAVSVPKIPRG